MFIKKLEFFASDFIRIFMRLNEICLSCGRKILNFDKNENIKSLSVHSPLIASLSSVNVMQNIFGQCTAKYLMSMYCKIYYVNVL